MGSGLILLVIVGAWLAVLVPMALRSHDTTTALSSVDRFSDAMRVLSRRQVPSDARRAFVVPGAPARAAAPAPPVSLAVRRRRTLLGLLGLTAVALVGSLVVAPLLYVHLVLDVLVVAFVVHCRRQAQLKAARSARLARATRSARPRRRELGAPAAGRERVGRTEIETGRRPAVPAHVPAHVAGIPSRMPARPAPLTAPLPAPAARHDEPVPAAALGSSWSPVPVPVPTYVTKAVAPPRRPRVLDLTKPGEWTAALEADGAGPDAGLDILRDDRDLDGILDREHRRAVND